MNRTRLIAAPLLILCAAAAYAQNRWIELATPPAAPEKSEPVERASDPVVPQLVVDPKRGQNDADARQCLELATNDRIHGCAEKYRPRVVHAKLTKTSQPDSKAKPADTPKLEVSTSLTTAKADAGIAAASKPAAPAGTAADAGKRATDVKPTAAKSADSGKAAAKPAESMKVAK